MLLSYLFLILIIENWLLKILFRINSFVEVERKKIKCVSLYVDSVCIGVKSAINVAKYRFSLISNVSINILFPFRLNTRCLPTNKILTLVFLAMFRIVTTVDYSKLWQLSGCPMFYSATQFIHGQIGNMTDAQESCRVNSPTKNQPQKIPRWTILIHRPFTILVLPVPSWSSLVYRIARIFFFSSW